MSGLLQGGCCLVLEDKGGWCLCILKRRSFTSLLLPPNADHSTTEEPFETSTDEAKFGTVDTKRRIYCTQIVGQSDRARVAFRLDLFSSF